MNEKSGRLKEALKIGFLTAFWVFMAMTAPFGCAPPPEPFATNLLKIAALVAAISFLLQFLRIMVQKAK